MNWKESLKPDWRKIVLSIPLLVLIILNQLELGFCGGLEFRPERQFILGFITCGQVWRFLSYFGEFFLIVTLTSILITPMYFIWIAAPYILSCVIVWIYDKIKKKKTPLFEISDLIVYAILLISGFILLLYLLNAI